MPDDIVKRLRHAQANRVAAQALDLPLGEAADEIEALREVVAMMAVDYVIPSRVPKHDRVIARALGQNGSSTPNELCG